MGENELFDFGLRSEGPPSKEGFAASSRSSERLMSRVRGLEFKI